MKCSKARSLFSAYLDKDLTFEEQGRVEEHLCGCSDCAAELGGMTRVQSLLHGLAPLEVGEDFCERVQRRVREAQDQPETIPAWSGGGALDAWRWWQRQVWLRPALGAALGLVAGVLVGVNAPQLAGRSAATTSVSAPMVAVPSLTTTGASGAGGVARDAGPFSGIDLTNLASLSDSARLGASPEYVLEPYVTDPQRGLVPATGAYGRAVGADWDDQNDAFVTF
jgi:hypothetical protein